MIHGILPRLEAGIAYPELVNYLLQLTKAVTLVKNVGVVVFNGVQEFSSLRVRFRRYLFILRRSSRFIDLCVDSNHGRVVYFGKPYMGNLVNSNAPFAANVLQNTLPVEIPTILAWR